MVSRFKSRPIRISEEEFKELINIKLKNNFKSLTEASREVARMIRRQRAKNEKIIREIKF